jgi:hypothetical protein
MIRVVRVGQKVWMFLQVALRPDECLHRESRVLHEPIQAWAQRDAVTILNPRDEALRHLAGLGHGTLLDAMMEPPLQERVRRNVRGV